MPIEDPPDLELLVYSKIFEILLDYTPWKEEFKEGNIIRFDTDESNDDPEKMHRADGDYPEALLEVVGGSSSGRDSGDQTFGTHAVAGCATWVEKQTHAFRLKLTSEKLSLLEQSRQRKLTLNALRLSGPRLGLGFVTKVAWRWSVVREAAGDDDQTYRQITTIDISVESESEGTYLTGEQ